jgi:RNA polymerase sigma-70 factor (ECF subfamily)
MTDGELVRQTLAGRTEAYGELVRRWTRRITSLCHAKVGCAATADDLAQEALLRGYRALASLAHPDNFGAWLCTIARNACQNWLKARERSQVTFSVLQASRNAASFLEQPAPPDSPPLEHQEELQALREAVAGLPEECREVLSLFYHQDLTYRDLAQLLGVSSATINARLTRARTLLRERLGGSRR